MSRILVTVPRGESEVVSTFPFFHKLFEEFQGSHVDVIADEKDVHLFEYLPFELKVYGIPAHKQGFLGIHHFAMNLHDVFNIDILFDLTSDLKSAYLSRHFKPAEKVGYETGINRFYLTKSYAPDENRKMDTRHVFLLERYLNKQFNDFKITGFEKKKEVENFFQSKLSNDYLVLALNDVIADEKYMFFWKSLLKEFKDQKIVLRMDMSSDLQEELVKDLDRSRLFLADGKGADYLSTVITNSKGVISNLPWMATLASYMSVESFSFVEKVRNIPYFEHFKVSPILVEYSANGPSKILANDDCTVISGLSEFTDYSLAKLKL